MANNAIPHGTVDRPAYRVMRGDLVRHARRNWVVMGIDISVAYGTRTSPVADEDRTRYNLRLRTNHVAPVVLVCKATDIVKIVAP